MLDFCGAHDVTADVEVIPIQKVNEAYERLLKSDVKYRFSIDMASLKSEIIGALGPRISNTKARVNPARKLDQEKPTRWPIGSPISS